jgi:hypothetical protein
VTNGNRSSPSFQLVRIRGPTQWGPPSGRLVLYGLPLKKRGATLLPLLFDVTARIRSRACGPRARLPSRAKRDGLAPGPGWEADQVIVSGNQSTGSPGKSRADKRTKNRRPMSR